MADINIIYKEIEQLSQKSTVSGAEKIVVSDTEFVTPSQIAGLVNVSGKQDTLVSGVNIKTINNLSILGSGNITIEGGGGGGGTVEWGNIGGTLSNQDDLNSALNAKAGTDVTGSLANLNTTVKTNLVAAINEVLAEGGGGGSAGNPIVGIGVPTPYDGTVIFTYKNGDTTTLDLNHSHPQYVAKSDIAGGTTGQVLTKNSNTDGDYTWQTPQGGGGAGKEDVSNKVTSLSAQSTDTQYPSAKCVYDIIGNVESLLAAL